MNLKYIYVLIVILLSSASLYYLVTTKDEYYYSSRYNETIALNADYTWYAVGSSSSSSGTYKITGNQVILTVVPFGNILTFTKIGNNLTNSKGMNWSKR